MTETVHLMAWTAGYLAGYERGYEIRGDEINATWPPEKVLVFGRWYDQATERQKWDRTAGQPRPTDNEVR